MNRRTFVAGLGASAVGTAGVATATGPAVDTDPTTLDVKVWATEEVITHESGFDPRRLAANQLRASLWSLANSTAAIDDVTVSVGEEAITGIDPDADESSLGQWHGILDGLNAAVDSNVLLNDFARDAHLAHTTTCHLGDGECRDFADINAAIVQGATKLYAARDPLADTLADPDKDGRWEDVNGDGRADVVDVQYMFDQLDGLRRPSLFDFNGDGATNVGDVQKLYNEVGTHEVDRYTPRSMGPYSNDVTDILAAVVHEVGHNLGLQHEMGEARQVTIGGTEYVLISPMLGNYYFNINPPDHKGESREMHDDVDHYAASLLLGEWVHENAGDVIYDEVAE